MKFSNKSWYTAGKSLKIKAISPILNKIQNLNKYFFRLVNVSYYDARDITYQNEVGRRVFLRTGFRGPLYIGRKYIFSSRRIHRLNIAEILNRELNSNCYSDDGNAMVVSSFLESSISPDGKFEVTKSPRVVKNKANYVVNPNSDGKIFVPKVSGFFHFYIQLVPLLLRLQDRYKIQIDLDLAKENIEILDYFGIESTESDNYMKKSKFLFSKIVKQNGLYPSNEDVIRLNSFHKQSSLSAMPSRNLFISRSGNANGRNLTNEKDVLEHLAPFGFERIQPEGLSFTEQTKLFAQARNIIAPHGAALSHLVAVPSVCNVIELNAPSNVRWHYRKMSATLNLNHTLIIGKETAGSDFSIDPRALVNFLVD